MAYLEIHRNGDAPQRIELEDREIMIGREHPAQIILASTYVSGQHARIVKSDNDYELIDLKSTNRTFVNDRQVENSVLLSQDDVIKIGDWELKFRQDAATGTEEEVVAEPALPEAQAEANSKNTATREADEISFKNKARSLLIEKMNLKKLSARDAGDEALREMTEERLDGILAELAPEMPAGIELSRLRKNILDDMLGLGPLEDFLEDGRISEIMVNAWDQIYYERAGKLHKSKKKFIDDAHVLAVIQRIVAPVGRSINESTPLVDARLKDGSRVNAIIPPLALQGPTITIRKFAKKRLTTGDLIRFGSIDDNMVRFLELAVRERQNIIISGGTGSGKTTLLNILSGFIPNDERIVTIEDAAELRLHQEHVISLETRPANMEGAGAYTIRDLVKNCLRMRPDRIVVGECRGGEALDMLQAMNTGHDGSLTTAHANSPRDVLSRLETMVLMSGMDLPVRAIREQIASAVNLIVQQSRQADGSRKITHITEVTGIEGEIILTQDIFRFEQQGFDDSGNVKGTFTSYGIIPSFVQDLAARGIESDLKIFENSEKGE
jgi:pilus assembly protein CpaF